MTRTKIVAALVAVLVIGAGAAAAVPGNAPAGDHAPDGDQRADGAQNESSDDAENVSEERRGPPADGPATDGPPTGDLPVPDHVSEIHSTIDSFLANDLSGTLGDAISDVVGW